MVKKTIELTEEQSQKVQLLEENGFSVGDAVDILFELKDEFRDLSEEYINRKISDANVKKMELQKQIDDVDREITVFSQLKDPKIATEEKQRMFEDEYSNKKTDDKIQESKSNINWKHDFFKL